MANTVLYESKGKVSIIKLNRPKSLNAMNDELIEDLISALQKAEADPEVRVAVVKGEGRAFCAGADLRDQVSDRTLFQYREHAIRLQEIGRLMLSMDKILIASIHGYAVGAGLELACNCDFRIVAEGTQMFSTETNVGATVTTGVTKLLPAIIGLGRAFDIFVTNEKMDATKAKEWGFANRVVPLDELEKATMELANKVAENYPLSLAFTRHSLYHGLGVTMEDVFHEETLAACVSFMSKERMTGMGSKIKK